MTTPETTPDVVAGMPPLRRKRRLLWSLAGFAAVSLAVLVVRYATRTQVVYGRTWPADQRVSCEAIDHQLWDRLLKQYVDPFGNVNYATWKETPSDVQALDDCLIELSRVEPDAPASKSARQAFWINAYNALTIRGILREYPTASVRDHTAGWFGYDIWRDLLLIVGERAYSLGQIEHAMLRPLQEPRIHFALVCASRGCPRLLNEAYSAAQLEEQLDRDARDFLADASKFRIDRATRVVFLSPIFQWYAADFGHNREQQLAAMAHWVPEESDRELLTSGNLRISYLDYDWSLNDQATLPTEPPRPP